MAPQVPLWQEIAKPLLDAKVPDNVYDAQRDNYFQQYVLPAALKAGESPSMARENFMKASERPDKSSMPRAALVGASALKALTDPLSLLMDEDQAKVFRTSNKQLVQRAAEEAGRQGISTTPYTLAGDLLGTAPYFVGGFGATAGLRAGAEAGMVGAGISETAAKIATEAATAGAIQGAYDAAKAEDGHRLVDGLQGAAIGTAFAGGLLSLGPLRKLIASRHGVSENVGQAVENTAKGVATPAEEAVAANVAQAKPEVAQTIQEVVAQQVQAAKKAGLPKDAMFAEPGGRLKIALQTADGKTYNVGGVAGVDIQNIGTLVDRISPHLDQGGQILSVTGDPLVQQKFLQSLEELNGNKGLYNVELPLGPVGDAAGVKVMTQAAEAGGGGSKTSAPSPETGATPSPSPATPEEFTYQGEKWKPSSTPGAAEWYESESGKMLPKRVLVERTTARTETGDLKWFGARVPPSEGLEVLPNGKVRDKASGTLYDSAFQALVDKGVVSADIKAYPQLKQLPDGRIFNMQNGLSYETLDEAVTKLAQEPPAKFGAADAAMGAPREAKRRPFAERADMRTDATVNPELAARLSKDSEIVVPPKSDVAKAAALIKGVNAGNQGAVDELVRLYGGSKSIKPYGQGLVLVDGSPLTAEGIAGELWEGFPVPGQFNTIGTVPYIPEDLKPALSESLGNHVVEQVRGHAQVLEPDNPIISKMDELYPGYKKVVDFFQEGKSGPRAIDRQETMWESPNEEAGMFDYTLNDLKEKYGSIDKALTRLDELTTEYMQGRKAKKAPPTLDEMEALQRQFEAARPGAQSKSLPTYDRQIVDEMAGNTVGQTFVGKGVQPRIVFDRGNLDPQVAFHETMHGLMGYTGLAQDFSTLEMIDKGWRKMVYKMTAAWPDEMRADYFKAGNIGEEVYAYLSSAIRTNDETMIQRFADADGGREGVMKWAAETTDTMLDSLAQAPDSVHKRVLERKLKEVFRRSTNSLRDLTGDTSDVYGTQVDILNGKYVVRTPEGNIQHFDDKDQLVSFLEKSYAEPLSTSSLVDETAMPQGVPRLARTIPPHSIGRKPIETPPPTMENPDAKDVGGALASFFIRPFYPWIDTVAKKVGRPELYDMFKGLDTKMVQRDAMIEQYENPLKRALVGKSLLETKYPPARQQDLYMYLQAKPGFEAQTAAKFNITPQEMSDIAMLRREVLDPLAAQSGVDFVKYVQEIAPLVRRTADPDAIKPSAVIPQRDADFWKQAIIKGEIDPFDKDLLRTAHSYVRLVARDKTIGNDLEAIGKMIDEKIPGEDDYRLGSLRPLLKRQLEYIKGRPDYTQRLLDGATQQIINTINGAVEAVNSKLPGNMKIPTIDSVPQDVLGRWILYSYAGGLALRPMVVFRDSMQLFLTTFPMLGGKYTTRGLIRAFGGIKEGTASDAWRIADQYGALMHQSDLQNLYSGSYETLAGGGKVAGKLTNFAEGSLKWLQWSNNSNRLVTFWGHAERNLDALAKNVPTQNVKGLVKDAGWQWLDDRLRDNFVKEAMSADASKWQDIAYRSAKELTDISQWNYRRGASPGIYKYSMGRLFGQYGTWPLNYIEYARRLATKGDAGDKAAALARLAIAHGAVLKTGEMFGIDTGQWVFTQPMAYGGSPLFQAVVNVPNSMDFESYRGADSRREIARIFWPMEIPGGLAAEKIYKAINADSPTALQEALGFQPLKSGEEDKGIHSLIP